MSDLARNTKFQISIASVFTNVTQVSEISGPDSSKEDIDVTDLDDDARSFLPGLRDEGTVTVTLLMDPNGVTFQALTDQYQLHTTNAFKEVWSDGTTWPFTGYVNGLSPVAAVGDALRCTVSVKVSEGITYPT